MKCGVLKQASRDDIRSSASHLEGNLIRVLANWILILSSLRKNGYMPVPHRLLNWVRMIQQRQRTMYRTGHGYCNKRPSDSPEAVSFWLSYKLGTSNNKDIILQRRKFFRINLKTQFVRVVNTPCLSYKNQSGNVAQGNNRCYGNKHSLISIYP